MQEEQIKKNGTIVFTNKDEFEKSIDHAIICIDASRNRTLVFNDFGANVVIKALAEYKKYRSIGTIERFEQLSEQFKPQTTDGKSCPKRHCNKCDKYRKENEKYHEIGTVLECQEAVEKQRAKKPIMKPYFEDMEEEYLCCPTCGDILTDIIPSKNEDFISIV